MKFSHEKPPIYDLLVKEFGVDWESVVITYGETVYSKRPISRDLEAHEGTHVRQQMAMGKEAWWERYLKDPHFRKAQEAEAYRKQWQFIKGLPENRNALFQRKLKLIGDFSGPMYGHICTSAEAERLIGK